MAAKSKLKQGKSLTVSDYKDLVNGLAKEGEAAAKNKKELVLKQWEERKHRLDEVDTAVDEETAAADGGSLDVFFQALDMVSL